MTADLLLGVDAGNSKVVALLARTDGSIVGSGRAESCGDIYEAYSTEAALAPVETSVATALDAACARPGDISSSVFSMAGADWPEDQSLLKAEMEHRDFGRRVFIVHDAVGALRAGSADGTGVVVACGTYATSAARAPSGALWHASWWQEPGGGRFLGESALRACCRAELGIDPPTSMKGRILDYFKRGSVEEVLHLLTARLAGARPDAGKLAHVVLDEAEAGDAVAQRIVRNHGVMLGDYATAAARKVGMGRMQFPLVLSGGVFRHSSVLHTQAIAERVHAIYPDVYLTQSPFEPAIGAVLLALEETGRSASADEIERLARTMPDTAFFES